MIHAKPGSLAVLAFSAVILTSCASLGGNVKGDFLCRAPGGSCAPSTVIDDQALAQIGEARPLPASQGSPWMMPKSPPPQVAQVGNGIVNTAPRVTQVVFPAFVDSNGYLHEARKVKMVTQAGGWAQLADAAPNPVVQVLRASQSNAALSAYKLTPEPVALSIIDADPNAPSADAIARARHRPTAKQPTTPDEIKSVVDAKLAGAAPTDKALPVTPVNRPAGFSGKVD